MFTLRTLRHLRKCTTSSAYEVLTKDVLRTLTNDTMTDAEWNAEMSVRGYPRNVDPLRDQAYLSVRPKNKDTSIILFPGQGTQYVGMGKDLLKYPMVGEMYEIASTVLGYDLKRLCFDGPKEELDKTVHSQPAVVVASLAAVQRLKTDNPEAVERCIATAGFGVGEIAALVFAGSISFEAGLKIAKVRAEAMQAAAELIPGQMMTVFLSPKSHIKYACKIAEDYCLKQGIEDVCCHVANFLSPECKVISGHEAALRFLQQHAAEFGIVRYKVLAVSGAFHTKLMAAAEPGLRAVLDRIQIASPSIPVHSNVDGKMFRNSDDVAEGVARQISVPIKWEQTMHVLYERNDGDQFPSTYECGPGRSMATILGMINKKAFDCTENIYA